MIIRFINDKVEAQCTSFKEAKKVFGGRVDLAKSLMQRINAIKAANHINDIALQRQFHFHSLKNRGLKKFDGYFAIDVRSRADGWRIILELLDEMGNPFIPCHIDVVADKVRIVEIREVSNHYE